MELGLANYEHFVHIRIIIGMVLAIAVARLVAGVSEFLQHPRRKQFYLVHLGWVLYLFLTITHFWWFEFGLVKVRVWSYGLYLFLISFACLFAFTASLLFPSDMTEYDGYEDYFQRRRRTFYSMFAVLAVVDLVDTAIKGADYFYALGGSYLIQQVVFIVMAVIAIFVSSKVYQALFVIAALAYKAAWIFSFYSVLD